MMSQETMKLSKLEERLLKEKFPSDIEYNTALTRLKEGEPLAYILGEWYFYNETYKVSSDCLIPRPETEHVVDELIRVLPENGRFTDLCTGSGCIAISVLCHRPDVAAVAVDISDKAIAIAKENAALNGVSDRISFICADIVKCDPLGAETFDAISSNPPYIRSSVIDTLQEQVKREPRIALDGGEDGLDFYRIIFNKYRKNIHNGGKIICEIGYDQGKILSETFGCRILKDYSHNDRVAVLDL